ncbi:MAG: tetratricopeptide repeat protein [Armatimonadetes bacterium]|nr:tetratricopeptide repeat protein [Armatimonadota bacterium]
MNRTSDTTEPGRGRSNAARITNLMRRANSLAEQGMYDEAIANIKEAMTMSPRDPKFSAELANIYRAQNRMEPAIEAMQRAMELDPHNGGMQQLLLRTLIETGRYDEAVSTSRKLIKRFPKNLLARDVLGIVYLQKGMLDQALKVTDELINLAPADSSNHFKKAVLLQQKGEIAPAMIAFLRALELDPNGEMADDTREAIAALDSYQLRQVLTVALEDAVFRAKLAIDPEVALLERGFHLSMSGIATLKQLDLKGLPVEPQSRYYH